MTDRLILDDRQRCLSFVATRVGEQIGIGAYEGIGLERNGELIAAVVYSHMTERNIVMTVAAEPGRRWLTPTFLRAAFRYPFVQLRLPRVTAFVEASNAAALKLDRHLGFVDEGCLRNAAEDGGDVMVLGMKREECSYLGQEIQSSAAA